MQRFKQVIKYGVYFLFFLLFGGCAKEKVDFLPVADLYLSVIDDNGQPVNGATVNLYDTQDAYEIALANKTNPPAGVRSLISAQATVTENGQSVVKEGYVHLDALDPNKPYYLLITYYDPVRQVNMSNVGISGYINPLPNKASIFAEVALGPDDGNIIFYSTANNKIPIEINVTDLTGSLQKNFTLSGIYTLASVPGVNDQNVARVPRSPGIYNYYAKSSDGCAWTGVIHLFKGQTVPVNLTKCNSGTVSFYATTDSDTLMPLTLKLNNVDSIGQITASRASLTCTDDKSNTLTFIRDAGLYTYVVRSVSGRCVWTGTLTILNDDCIIVPLGTCE